MSAQTIDNATDAEIKDRIETELRGVPSVDHTHVGVSVTDGAVTLSGEVESYPEKMLAAKAVLRVTGVLAVAENITVRSTWGPMNDTDIARQATEALEQAVDVPVGLVRATVNRGHLRLTGSVRWQFQREAAERSVSHLRGATDVSNAVTVNSSVSAPGVSSDVDKTHPRELIGDQQMLSERHDGSLLRETDLTKAAFLSLVQLAGEMRLDRTGRSRLAGKCLALVFAKGSTRTRCAFEVAAHLEGAHVTYLDPSGSHMGSAESVPDTARVLGRMFDGIAFRGAEQDTVEQLAEFSGVPVWNGLTDQWHPTQMLADILTMVDNHHGPVESIVVAFLGDGRNNVARSLFVTCALLGMDVRIAAPRELWPPADVVETAHRLSDSSNARLLVTDNVEDAVDGADFVYTDVWVSMGESPQSWADRVPLLLPYRVTETLLKSTGNPKVKFLHCLPSVHDCSTALGERVLDEFGLMGAEVTDEVFTSPSSLVFDQAENRLHTIRALLVTALGN